LLITCFVANEIYCKRVSAIANSINALDEPWDTRKKYPWHTQRGTSLGGPFVARGTTYGTIDSLGDHLWQPYFVQQAANIVVHGLAVPILGVPSVA